MTDIVQTLETICNDLSIKFRYGNKEHLNLIEGSGISQDIHLLLYPPNRIGQFSDMKRLKTNEVLFSGKFMLLVPSDLADEYYNNTVQVSSDSKYSKHIEPLFAIFQSIGNKLINCMNGELLQWDCVDVINILDANKDGLYCTYRFKSLE